jgi:hypothetical protein
MALACDSGEWRLKRGDRSKILGYINYNNYILSLLKERHMSDIQLCLLMPLCPLCFGLNQMI